VEGTFRGGAIRATSDRPPVVFLRSADHDAPATLAYDAADDLGLARVTLEARRIAHAGGGGGAAGTALPIDIAVSDDARERGGEVAVPVDALHLKPGEAAEVRLLAEDRAGQVAETAWRPLERLSNDAVERPPAKPSARPRTTRSNGAARNAVATTLPSAVPSEGHASPFVPAGDDGAIRAYFDAIRGAHGGGD
jgi:hypothetical protein